MIKQIFTVAFCALVMQSSANDAANDAAKKDAYIRDQISWTLYQEARGESFEGKHAVATVIYNRARNQQKTLLEVITATYQFTGCDSAAPEWYRDGQNMTEDELTERNECHVLATQLVQGRFYPAAYWDHYFNPALCSPRWESALIDVKVIGKHKFGRMRLMGINSKR
jgi:spore germination cell wall hydrolase CwlJ-like protein